MSAIVHPAPPSPRHPELLRRSVTGTPTEVSTTIERVRARGFLVAETMPQQVHGDPRRVRVVVTLRRVPVAVPVPTTRPSVARRAVKPLAIAGAALAVLTGLGFGLYLLIRQTVEAAAAASPLAIGVLVVLGALVLIGIAKRKAGSSCSGIHCGGCKGGH